MPYTFGMLVVATPAHKLQTFLEMILSGQGRSRCKQRAEVLPLEMYVVWLKQTLVIWRLRDIVWEYICYNIAHLYFTSVIESERLHTHIVELIVVYLSRMIFFGCLSSGFSLKYEYLRQPAHKVA